MMPIEDGSDIDQVLEVNIISDLDELVPPETSKKPSENAATNRIGELAGLRTQYQVTTGSFAPINAESILEI